MFDKELHEKYMRIVLKELFSSDVWKYLAFKGWTLTYFVYFIEILISELPIRFKENNILKWLWKVLIPRQNIESKKLY